MGKGDKRTRRGKIFAGTYGKTRQKPVKARPQPPTVEAKPAPKRRAKAPAAPAE